MKWKLLGTLVVTFGIGSFWGEARDIVVQTLTDTDKKSQIIVTVMGLILLLVACICSGIEMWRSEKRQKIEEQGGVELARFMSGSRSELGSLIYETMSLPYAHYSQGEKNTTTIQWWDKSQTREWVGLKIQFQMDGSNKTDKEKITWIEAFATAYSKHNSNREFQIPSNILSNEDLEGIKAAASKIYKKIMKKESKEGDETVKQEVIKMMKRIISTLNTRNGDME